MNLKSIRQELLSLALPMALTQLIAVGSGFIAMVMLGRLGHDVLAACALIIPSRLSLLLIGSSILFSLSILVGHAFGEKNYEKVGNFMQQGWTLAILLSIPIMIITWNIDKVLLYFGQSPRLTEIVRQFFHANVWQTIPFFLAICNQQLCYGTRKQKIDLFANICAMIIGLTSAYILIFGKWGFPTLGVAGLGYAWVLQGLSYFSITFLIIFFSPFFKKFNLFVYRVHKHLHDLVYMFKVGWPICVQMGGEVLSIFVIATMVGWTSVHALAAYQIVTQYQFLIIVPLFALSQASGVLVGQALGEKNYSKILHIGHAGIFFSLAVSISFAVIFIVFPKYLAALYLSIHDPAVADTLHIVVILFAIIAVQQIVDGVRNVLTGSLRGLFDTKFPMYIGLIVIWLIGIPLGYLLAFVFHLGVYGLIIGPTIGFSIGMLILLYRWQTKNHL